MKIECPKCRCSVELDLENCSNCSLSFKEFSVSNQGFFSQINFLINLLWTRYRWTILSLLLFLLVIPLNSVVINIFHEGGTEVPPGSAAFGYAITAFYFIISTLVITHMFFLAPASAVIIETLNHLQRKKEGKAKPVSHRINLLGYVLVLLLIPLSVPVFQFYQSMFRPIICMITAVQNLTPQEWIVLEMQRGNFEQLEHYIEIGGNVDVRLKAGRTPLMLAADAGNLQAVQRLLEAGADINASDIFHNTPLHYALGMGRQISSRLEPFTLTPNEQAIVYELLARKVEVTKRNFSGYSPLTLAVLSGDREIIIQLLALGARPLETQGKDEDSTSSGIMPLTVAVEEEQIDTVKLLFKHIDREAPHDVSLVKDTALRIAIRKDNIEMVNLCLSAGANVHHGKPLTIAVDSSGKNSFQIMQILQQSGASMNEKTKALFESRQRDLLWAAKQGDIDWVKTLLAHGAKINYDGEDRGYYAIESALKGNNPEILMLFISRGADVNAYPGVTGNAPPPFQQTHLAFAMRNPYPDLLNVLLDAGAKVDYPGHPEFNEAFQVEAKKARPSIQAALRSRGLINKYPLNS